MTLIPIGQYDLQVDHAEMMVSPVGAPYIKVTFIIRYGEFKDLRAYHNLVPQAEASFRRDLEILLTPDVEHLLRTEELNLIAPLLWDKRCKGMIKTRMYKNKEINYVELM